MRLHNWPLWALVVWMQLSVGASSVGSQDICHRSPGLHPHRTSSSFNVGVGDTLHISARYRETTEGGSNLSSRGIPRCN